MPSRSRSLRFKLATGFVLVFLITQVVLIGGIVYFRQDLVDRSLDDELTRAAEDMVENVVNADEEWNDETVPLQVPADARFELYALRDEEGALLYTSPGTGNEDLPFTHEERVPTGPVGGVIKEIRSKRAERLTGRSGRLRLITLPFRYNDRLFFFQAAVRNSTIDRLFGPYFDLVVLGIPVGLIAAAVAAWFLAGRVVSPIDELSRAARDVSPARIGRRFELDTTNPELERLKEELNSALARIEEGYRAQEHFIGNVSHELKTPISVLLAEAQVSRMSAKGSEKGFAIAVERELKRLARMVESILVLAQHELSVEIAREDVAVHDLVLEAVQRCHHVASSCEVRLIPMLSDPADGEDEPVVSGDPALLESALENLVRNAIKHSPVESMVEVTVEVKRREVRVIVKDQGPGIPDEFLERIFERFVQVPGSTGRGGTGLGLALVKNIVALHNGRIEVRNLPSGGCAFTLMLPLGAA